MPSPVATIIMKQLPTVNFVLFFTAAGASVDCPWGASKVLPAGADEILVCKPLPSVGSVNSNGSTITGSAEAGSLNPNGSEETGGLNANGSAEAGSLNPNGSAETGGLNANGSAEAGSLISNGSAETGGLNANGSAGAGSLNVNGSAETGALNANGSAVVETGRGGVEEALFFVPMPRSSITGWLGMFPGLGANSGEVCKF